MAVYYRIAQLAHLFGISTAALRLYDERSLLRPSYRDPSSGYRYYTDADAARLSFLLQLRECGMSLEQLQAYVSGAVPVPEQIARLRVRRQRIQECINALTPLTNPMDYEPEMLAVPACSCLSAEVRVSQRSELLRELGGLERMLMDRRIQTDGIMRYFVLYDDRVPDGKPLKATVCVRVKDAVGQVKIPACRGVSVTHAGTNHDLSEAYNALHSFMARKHFVAAGPVREYFFRSPVEGYGTTAGNLITRIFIPVQRELNRRGQYHAQPSAL